MDCLEYEEIFFEFVRVVDQFGGWIDSVPTRDDDFVQRVRIRAAVGLQISYVK